MNTMHEVLAYCKNQRQKVTVYCGNTEASKERYIRSVGDEIVEFGNSPEQTNDKQGQDFVSIAAITNIYVCVAG